MRYYTRNVMRKRLLIVPACPRPLLAHPTKPILPQNLAHPHPKTHSKPILPGPKGLHAQGRSGASAATRLSARRYVNMGG